jgi:hypothetical protein
MKTKLLGLVAGAVLLGVSQASAATLVGTTTTAMGIDGLVVDGLTYNVTFVNGSYNSVYASTPPTFSGNASAATDASAALAAALTSFSVTALSPLGTIVAPQNVVAPYSDSPPLVSAGVAECITSAGACTSSWTSADVVNFVDDSLTFTNTDYTVFAETPLPAALPLFATCLGAMGLLGWRRKRKAAALAPA